MMELDGDTGITNPGVRRSAAIEVCGSVALFLSISGMRRKSLSEAQLAERDWNRGDRPRLISSQPLAGAVLCHQYINQYNRHAGRQLAFNYRASRLGTSVFGDILAEMKRAVNQDGNNDFIN